MIQLPRIVGLTAAVVIFMAPCITYSQHLSSARGVALGGFTSLSTGLSSLDWNPSALLSIHDWEFDASNYLPLNSRGGGFTLQSTAIGKRFLDEHALAVRYAPGKITEFVVPRTFTFADSSVAIQTTFEQKISYQEPYALGYAYRLSDAIFIGVAGRFLQEKVTDTKYFVDSGSTIRSRVVDFLGSSWAIDLGSLWKANADWKFGLAVKNLFRLSENELPDEVAPYRLDVLRFFRLGIGYTHITDLLIGLDVDTERRFRVGLEWNALQNVFARSGIYFDANAHQAAEALAFGIGGSYEFLEFDVSYLKFFSQTNRTGTAELSSFNVSEIKDVEYNPFTSDRISLTAKLHLGRIREVFARIEHVEVLGEVYPASSLIYSYTPIGKARVRNITDKPITAKVSFYVDHVMDVPTESMPVAIPTGERLEIPLYAIFNERIKSVASTGIREGIVTVHTQLGGDFDDRYQTPIVIHGRNNWNGDITLLKYFITPEDPDVLKFTRAVLSGYKDRIDSTTPALRDFVRAKILFDEFAKRLAYVHDPKQSQDFVQYPSETLSLHGGDCDDMTACYSTLLTSIGISVAFIDVVPPQSPSEAHIYMMFDSGVEARNAQFLSDNPKRYVIRKNDKGIETAWIPIETTVIRKGFDEAWSGGAKEYFDDVEIGLGLLKGWVRVVNLQTIF